VAGAAGLLVIYPDDVDALARKLWTLPDLIDYKLHRRLIFDKPDPETQYDVRLFEEFQKAKSRASGSNFRDLSNVLAEVPDDIHVVPHPQVERVIKNLEIRRSCFLIGSSSSGKSILSLQIGRRLLLAGHSVVHLNLGTMATLPGNALEKFILTSGEDRPEVAILDDLQSSPAGSRYLLCVANLARRASIENPPAILAITWSEFAQESLTWMEDCLPLYVRSDEVWQGFSRTFGSSLQPSERDKLIERFGDDLLLLRAALELGSTTKALPSHKEVAQSIWQRRTEGFPGNPVFAKRIALVAGSLGRYDVPTPRSFLIDEAAVGSAEIEKAELSGLLRRVRDYVTLGHRSLCALLVDWLNEQGAWQMLSERGTSMSSANVMLDYLRSLGSGLAVETLRALQARAGFKQASQLNKQAAVTVEIWKAFDTVVERIEHQQAIDPTWGGIPSSAMFAVQALSQVGKAETAAASSEFIRRHWKIIDGRLEINVKGLKSAGDFQEIGKDMAEEDTLIAASGMALPFAPAQSIDLEQFHWTWLSGVFLCAEAAVASDSEHVKEFAKAVEATQLRSGAFYPERVPWATARVLLGLAAAGQTIKNSTSVVSATQWLIADREVGGARRNDGLWESGTGTWNSRLETTGMVLLALAAVGVDSSKPELGVAREYLLSQRHEWIKPEQEIDGAMALQAYLEAGGAWENVAREAQQLSRWAIGEAFWRTATVTSEKSLKQSCNVAQIASHLVSIGWTAVRTNLPAFFDALAVPGAYDYAERLDAKRASMESTPVGDADDLGRESESASTRVEETSLRCLKELSRISLSEATVIGKYRRYDERVRNALRRWAQRIARPLRNPSEAPEHFLIWALPGSGKTFLIQETARSIKPAIPYFELNVAKTTREEFLERIEEIKACKIPSLCLIDEVDARTEEEWVYESFFSLLDPSDRHVVFVLIGSSPTGIAGLVRSMRARKKGRDLVDRVKEENRFDIPPMSLEDRVTVIASQIYEAMSEQNQRLTEIEKLALYYVLVNDELQTPRQLHELALGAVQRKPLDESRIQYDDLFLRFDHRNQDFYGWHRRAAQELWGVFVRIEE
jgi:hypothetical protein